MTTTTTTKMPATQQPPAKTSPSIAESAKRAAERASSKSKALSEDSYKREFEIIDLLKDEIEKSGELYLKVALWKVLLQLLQKYEDNCAPLGPESAERLKLMITSLLGYSHQLIETAKQNGGFGDKDGVTEQVIRDNIEWLRDKLSRLQVPITDARKKHILSTLFSAES